MRVKKTKAAARVDTPQQPVQRFEANKLPSRRRFSRLAGHLWTVLPAIVSFIKRPAEPRARLFRTIIKDPVMGQVRLTGLLSEVPGADTIVLIVHGFSGDASRPYWGRAPGAAEQAGFSSLRLLLRGAGVSR